MPDASGEATVARAVVVLRAGGTVAFPTETVYGLGADATNPEAVKKIFAIKRRPADHPLIVHLADVAQLPLFARDIPETAWRLAARFWPGPIPARAPQLSRAGGRRGADALGAARPRVRRLHAGHPVG